MKVNFPKTIIAIAICLLIAYGLYRFNGGENKMVLCIGGFLFLVSALIVAIGTSFQQSRTTTNVRVVASVFFSIAMISNVLFTFISFSIPAYIIVNGILYLIFIN